MTDHARSPGARTGAIEGLGGAPVPSVVVVTSCTGSKATSSDAALTQSDFRIGGEHLKAREWALRREIRPAEEMYTGEQHVRLMRGVRAARDAGHDVRVRIVSAGYGLISEQHPVAPYDVTLSNMSRPDARDWGAELGLPFALRALLLGGQDLTIVALGETYLDACGIKGAVRSRNPVWFLGGAGLGRRIEWSESVRHVRLETSDTARFGVGLVGLKGEVVSRMLERVAAGGALDPKAPLIVDGLA